VKHTRFTRTNGVDAWLELDLGPGNYRRLAPASGQLVQASVAGLVVAVAAPAVAVTPVNEGILK
jgi:hypothetical protein